MIQVILRLEAATFLITALISYHYVQGGWIWFVVLFLTPDLSMLGYLVNRRLGATIYNAVHTYTLALGLVGLGTWLKLENLFAYGLILFAHITLDRILGFGLKYPTDFKSTHLQRI